MPECGKLQAVVLKPSNSLLSKRMGRKILSRVCSYSQRFSCAQRSSSYIYRLMERDACWRFLGCWFNRRRESMSNEQTVKPSQPRVGYSSKAVKTCALLTICMMLLAALMVSNTGLAHAQPQPGQYFDHVVIVLMENTGISATYSFCGPNVIGPCSSSALGYVIGNPNAPNMNAFYSNHALAQSYSGITHPSAPNYESLLGGEHSYYTSDGLSNWLDPGTNLVDRLVSSGLTYNAYAEGASGSQTCSFSPPRGADHFPFLMFTDNNVDSRCANFINATPGTDTELISSLNSASPSNFYWLTPTDADNCHDPQPSGTFCDTYFNNIVTAILGTSIFTNTNYRSALFVTFDEGGNTNPSDYVYTVMAGPQAKTSYSSNARYSHYSWLKTIEDNWGLTCFSNECSSSVSDMSEFFIPSFVMSTSPSSVSIFCNLIGCDPGHTVNSTLTITGLNGFNGFMTLSYIGPPNQVSGVTLTGPPSANVPPGTPALVTVTAHGSGTTSGTFVWTINGSVPGFTINTTVTIRYTWCAHCVLPP